MKHRLCRCEVMLCIVKFCASHKVKLSVPPTPAGASLAVGILHAPKVCFTCRKAHLVEKERQVFRLVFSFSGSPCWTRTTSVCNSGSISPHFRRLISPCCGTTCALPLPATGGGRARYPASAKRLAGSLVRKSKTQQNKKHSFRSTFCFGSPCWTRTNDPAVNSRMLYQLS